MELLRKIEKCATEDNFSGVVEIRHGKDIIFQKAYGMADCANERYIDTDTIFGIASGTKFFTALGIGLLINDGKLALDTKALDIIDYPFKSYNKDFTIEQLLTHTSGIPDYYDEDVIEDFENFQIDKPWYQVKSPSDYFTSFPDGPFKTEPGKAFKYNNGGYVLLAAIIESKSRMSFADYMKEKLFKPLGMDRTGLYPMNNLPKNTAIGYLEDGSSNVFKLPIVGGGDGGAFTTLKDINILWDALYEGQLLNDDLTKLFTSSRVSTDPEDQEDYYGYGSWFRTKDGNVSVHSISGVDAGVSFVSANRLEHNIRYTILSNTENGAWSISKLIREYYA